MSDAHHESHGDHGHDHSTRREFLFGLFGMFSQVTTSKGILELMKKLNLFLDMTTSAFKGGGGGGDHGHGHGGDHGHH